MPTLAAMAYNIKRGDGGRRCCPFHDRRHNVAADEDFLEYRIYDANSHNQRQTDSWAYQTS